MWLTIIINTIFGVGLFINACLFIPQALRIIRTKCAYDLSLTTFIGFCLTQMAAIAYGYIHNDLILMVGYILSLISCGFVTILIIIYRKGNLASKM